MDPVLSPGDVNSYDKVEILVSVMTSGVAEHVNEKCTPFNGRGNFAMRHLNTSPMTVPTNDVDIS